MRRIVIHDYWGDHVEPWLRGLIAYFEESGDHVDIWTRNTLRFSSLKGLKKQQEGLRALFGNWVIKHRLEDVDHVYMWNGQNDHHQVLRSLCSELGIPCSILEVGYFPQSEWFTIDPVGINATASLMADPLDWIEEEHTLRLEELRSTYLGGLQWRGGGGYILVPMQLGRDTNVRDHSDVEDMQELISACEERFEGERLLFKVHPRDKVEYITKHELVRTGSFLEMAVDADQVVGLNSTCLLESTLLGAPTEALGNGFLRAHTGNEEKLLAALVDKQVPVDNTDIEYWVSRYSSTQSALLSHRPHQPSPPAP